MIIYRIHISLLDIRPLIWRRVELSSQTTLKQFHRILQIVMGWENYHLHDFLVGTKRYGIPDPDYDDPGDVIVESKIPLSEVLPLAGAEISYVYDFSDNWRHVIELEEIVPARPEGEYPRVNDGARSCPLEDSGGITGYPKHQEDPDQLKIEHKRAANADPYGVPPMATQRKQRDDQKTRAGPRMTRHGLHAARNSLEYWSSPSRQDHSFDIKGALAQNCEARAPPPIQPGIAASHLTHRDRRLLP